MLSTNFYVSKEISTEVENPDNGLWRYATLQNALEKNSTPNKNKLMAMMKSAKFFMNDNDIKESLKRENKNIKDPKTGSGLQSGLIFLIPKKKA